MTPEAFSAWMQEAVEPTFDEAALEDAQCEAEALLLRSLEGEMLEAYELVWHAMLFAAEKARGDGNVERWLDQTVGEYLDVG